MVRPRDKTDKPNHPVTHVAVGPPVDENGKCTVCGYMATADTRHDHCIPGGEDAAGTIDLALSQQQPHSSEPVHRFHPANNHAPADSTTMSTNAPVHIPPQRKKPRSNIAPNTSKSQSLLTSWVTISASSCSSSTASNTPPMSEHKDDQRGISAVTAPLDGTLRAPPASNALINQSPPASSCAPHTDQPLTVSCQPTDHDPALQLQSAPQPNLVNLSSQVTQAVSPMNVSTVRASEGVISPPLQEMSARRATSRSDTNGSGNLLGFRNKRTPTSSIDFEQSAKKARIPIRAGGEGQTAARASAN